MWSELRAAGPPDFDTRPGEPLRSTIQNWLRRCPSCGYCAEDISTIHEDAAPVVQTAAYALQLCDPAFPEKAREFLAHALILESVNQLADAGWTALHAAWVCDDAGAAPAAMSARLRALDYWKRGKLRKQAFSDSLAMEFAIAADVYRRAGEFATAVMTCSEALDIEELTPLMNAILRREKSLAEQKDNAAHSLKELPGFVPRQ